MKSYRLKNIIFTLYLLLIIIDRLFGFNNGIIIVRMIQLLGTILFILIINSPDYLKVKAYKRFIISSIFVLFIFSLFSGIFKNSIFNFFVIFNILGFYGAGLYIIGSQQKIKIFSTLFWVVTSLFLFYYLSGVNISKWNNGSYNHLSVLMIFLATMLYLENHRNNEKLNIIPSIITLIICLYATGRSGIISSSLLVFSVIIIEYSKPRHIFIIGLSVFIALFMFSNYVIEFWKAGTIKFYEQGFSEEGRLTILNFFLNNINLKSIIFGVDFKNLFIYEDLTTHNSFLSLHSRFGLGILLIISQIFFIIRKSITQNKLYTLIIIIILIRSTTDSILISDGFMFGIIFYTIYFLLLRRNKLINC